jgi:RNA polymerase sigma factor (sigma-70 family)
MKNTYKIYEENYDKVYNYMIKNYYNFNFLIEDYINDTFIDFMNYYDETRSAPSTFWILLLRNKMASIYKYKNKYEYNNIFSVEITNEYIDDNYDIYDEEENNIIKNKKLKIIHDQIDKLNKQDKDIVFEYFFNNELMKNISIKLDININTIKSTISRFRKKNINEWEKTK